MSLIGTLDQFSLSNVLQRIETHEKTGMLVLKQGVHWVEFYFRNGRLLCIGPLLTHATLGERLVQDRVISQKVLYETLLVVGQADHGETRMAKALMELGYVSRDELRAWVIEKAVAVLQALVLWDSGEIHFEESTPPPAHRLLASMSISSLLEDVSSKGMARERLSAAPLAEPVQPVAPSRPVAPQTPASYSTLAANGVQEKFVPQAMMPTTPKADVTRVPTLTGTSQFMDESVYASAPGNAAPVMQTQVLPETEAFSPLFFDTNDADFSSTLADLNNDNFASSVSASIQPVPVMQPVPPRRIDTSFMRPDMVLMPVDLSAFREQNPQVQLTPDQWRLLTRVDGRTSLQQASHELAMLPEMVCQVAGELIAEGLVCVSRPEQLPMSELSPIARELAVAGLGGGYVLPGQAAAAGSPWSAALPVLPSSDVAGPFMATNSFETVSQWGNGGNGATFVPGRGWIATPQQMQPLQTSGPLGQSGIYVLNR